MTKRHQGLAEKINALDPTKKSIVEAYIKGLLVESNPIAREVASDSLGDASDWGGLGELYIVPAGETEYGGSEDRHTFFWDSRGKGNGPPELAWKSQLETLIELFTQLMNYTAYEDQTKSGMTFKQILKKFDMMWVKDLIDTEIVGLENRLEDVLNELDFSRESAKNQIKDGAYLKG